ncbi:4-(cytidine 5'-diphospho)-2-C-methyl-D-erythritol kinase [Thalassococcus sp. BH17M4-6]|uniref:4-(cytidine 5'-diphospho)-2-C-methyl-D-erythritol kinase n=1 Tax=Thalassococcus sp. BH17M4-6 TaxID=3413148 RepID=UPI003BE4D61E
MARIDGRAPAKVNLSLYLTGLRDDGYHLIDSLVVFAEVGDDLSVSPARELRLQVDGLFAKGVPTDAANLVLRAAEQLREMRGVTAGAAIRLTKNLPHGGGIGGGSSDAACAIRLLSELWGCAPLTAQEALPLGADVPVCLTAPRAMRMRGIGEVLTPAPMQPTGWLVLVNPGVGVPTGRVFDLHDRLNEFSSIGMDAPGTGRFADWLAQQRNDLTPVACHPDIAPVVQDVLAALRGWSDIAEMSGSGSTCWGWFDAEETATDCAAGIAADHPDWWGRATRILS